MAIFYLSFLARANVDARPAMETHARTSSVVVHFYIREDEPTDAGSSCMNWCDENGFEFIEYSYLPQEESLETLHPLQEHEIAFLKAEETGLAVLVSQIFDGNANAIDIFDFLNG
jgi:hypothetical protein